MSFYIIEDDDGNTMDYNGYFNCPISQTELFDEPNEPAQLAKELGGHVLKLTEEQKVKLPREVGEELEDWLKTDSVDTIITDLVCVSEGDPQAVRDWWDSTFDATYLIADMARYGWETEKETLYNVKVPHTKDVWYYKSWDKDLLTVSYKKLCSEFTEAEIEHYGLQDCKKEEVTDDEYICSEER